MAQSAKRKLLVKERYAWVPKALRDGSELGNEAAKIAEEFLLIASFTGVAGACERFRQLGDRQMAQWFKERIERGLADRPSADNPLLDAALLMGCGVHALGREIASLAKLGNHPSGSLLLGEDLWKAAQAHALFQGKAHATSCQDVVALLRPAYRSWLDLRDAMVAQERRTEGCERSYNAEAMDATLGGFFRALETNRPTGILRALVWAGILSLDAERPVWGGKSPLVWINGALAVATTMGGNCKGTGRTCHHLLDECYLGGKGPVEDVVGLGATVFALTTVAGAATKATDKALMAAYGFGQERTSMVYTAAQLLNGVPLPALNSVVVGVNFAPGDEILRHMPGYVHLGILERRKVSPWQDGAVHRAFAKSTWNRATDTGCDGLFAHE